MLDHEPRRVEIVRKDRERIVELSFVTTQRHLLNRLLPTRCHHFFPDKEKTTKKTFFTLLVDKINQDSISRLDDFFILGNLPKFTQVLDASVTPWKTAETHYAKFILCNQIFYIFSESNYNHHQAYQAVSRYIDPTAMVQCAGEMYIATDQGGQNVIRRSISGYSETLAHVLSIKDSINYRKNLVGKMNGFIQSE